MLSSPPVIGLPGAAFAAYEFVASYTAANGFPPTVREVALQLCCTTSTAWGHLGRLRRLGLVDWEEGKPRTLRLTFP